MFSGYAGSPPLGLFAAMAYFAFVTGAVLLWRNRGEIREWSCFEFGAFRSEFFRRDIPTRWSSLRENECLNFAESAASQSNFPSRSAFRPLHYCQIVCGAGLVFLGQIIFLLTL
jgi:hypothetical protein